MFEHTPEEVRMFSRSQIVTLNNFSLLTSKLKNTCIYLFPNKETFIFTLISNVRWKNQNLM